MKNPVTHLILFIAFILLAGLTAIAQDSTSLKHYKYAMLRETTNSGAPNFNKYKTELEDGLKKLLAEDSLHVLKNQKEVTEKGLNECDILTCTYTLGYSTGMMFNANIKAALRLEDCHKRELFSGEEKKMTGAVVGANVYLKLFEKILEKNKRH